MTEHRTINVTVTEREDGGINVCSADLPGLILSGQNKPRILSMIQPAATALLKQQGVADPWVTINATIVAYELKAPET